MQQTTPDKKENTIYSTNDIKLTAALVTAGHNIVNVSSKENTRNKKTEVIFSFSCTEDQNRDMIKFLSGNLKVDAKSLMDNRDCLLSYVANGSRELIEKVNKRSGK